MAVEVMANKYFLKFKNTKKFIKFFGILNLA